jgi:hypothetical protein
VAIALEAVAGAHAHPVPFRDAGGEFGHGQAADGGVHAVVGADGQDVVEAERSRGAAKFKASVDLVAGQPPGRYAQVTDALEHSGGQLWLGDELDVVRNAGQ